MKKYFFVLILVFTSIFATVASADCTGVIVNNSTQPWKFRFASDDQPEITGVTCSYDETCTIEAGQTATLHYMKQSFGNVYITDYTRNQKYYYYVYEGKMSNTACPNINHFTEKHTGSVSLNEPSYGSFTIEQDAW